jgi:hypothetical protein
MTNDELIEQASHAFRERDRRSGRIVPSSAWLDLDADGREALFEATGWSRTVEAALDPEGLSATARAVLGRIRGA